MVPMSLPVLPKPSRTPGKVKFIEPDISQTISGKNIHNVLFVRGPSRGGFLFVRLPSVLGGVVAEPNRYQLSSRQAAAQDAGARGRALQKK